MVSVPPVFHGGHGVADQVREHLHDLIAVDFRHRIGQAVLDADRDAFGHGDREHRPIDQLAEVVGDADDLVLPGEMEQAGDDLLAAVGLLGDHHQVLAHLRLRLAFVQQQVGVHQHDAQRIVHFVGDAGGQLAHAGQLFRLHEGLLGGGQLDVRRLDFPQGHAELIDRVRQAHLGLGQPLVNGDGMLAAGVVAAGPAVQFVAGEPLAHAVHDLVDLAAGRRGDPLVVGLERAAQVQPATSPPCRAASARGRRSSSAR